MKSFKDFFYFLNKSERIGILVLLVFVVISALVYICLSNFTNIDLGYYQNEQIVQNDFVTFSKELQPKTEIIDDLERINEEDDITNTKTKKRKSINEKLSYGEVIDLNSANISTLMRIPGIGKTFAERIVEYRNLLGGFYKLEQLQDIKGISNNKFTQILPYITLQKKHKVFNINTISEEVLRKHPYLTDDQVSEIVILRSDEKIESVDKLLERKKFKVKDLEKVAPYFSFQ